MTKECDILSKYTDVFPEEFIKSVENGVSWLCVHNNIAYQTSIMVASDKVLYNTSGSSVLRVGLINTDSPLSGLTYYEVKSIEVGTDEVSGKLVFNVKMKYNTPMGLSVVLIPITYFELDKQDDSYSKAEIDALIKELKDSVETKADAQVTNELVNGIYMQLDNVANNESVTKLENKVDDMLQSLALDYVTNEKLDEELAKIETGDKTLDLTSYLKVKDAEDKYATKQSVTDVDTKVDTKVTAVKTEFTQQLSNNLENVISKKRHAMGFFFNNGDMVTKDNTLYIAKTAFMGTNDFNADKNNLVELVGNLSAVANKADKSSLTGLATEEYVNTKVQEVKANGVNKDDVIQALKNDQEFKNSVKGETGATGEAGPQGEKGADGKSVTVEEVKPVVVEALKQDVAFKESVKGDTGAVGPQGPAGEKGENGVSPSATEVANEVKTGVIDALKADTAFREQIKGETGPQGPAGDAADVSTLVTKDELADYIKSADADTKYAKATDLNSKADTTALEAKLDKATYDTDKATFVTDDNKTTKLSDYLTVTAAEEKYQPKTA